MNGKKFNLLQLYFDQIKNFPLLTFEEELELARRIQQGEEGVRQKLIESNLRLVVKIARSYLNPDIALLDLIQEGNLGLIHAAERYDPARNVRFSTYACWWIKQNIILFLTNKRRLIRLPQRKEELFRKIQRSYHSLSQRLTREPNPEEVAREIGVPMKDVNSVLGIANGIVSLNTGPEDAETAEVLKYQEDYTYNPERTLMNKVSRDSTLEVLNRLKEREKKVLMYRYQINGSKGHTLKKISAKMGISAETVRQIEIRAIHKIQNSPELRNVLC
ncbi:MAG: RNA polymerase sigma factor RpoD/SigA [Treponema sp.]|jgi:RNA polymerase primary sigma factor|nr:RNA polymerase sigma factor RpoD/SigA [Treponema sp.]